MGSGVLRGLGMEGCGADVVGACVVGGGRVWMFWRSHPRIDDIASV